MQEPTEITHGDETYTVRVYDDGRLDCPLCGTRTIFENETCLRRHLSAKHEKYARQTHECEECGDEFSAAQYRDRRFCSQACSAAFQRDNTAPTTHSCKHCGDEFTAAPSHDRKFCSQQCYGDWRSEKGATGTLDMSGGGGEVA